MDASAAFLYAVSEDGFDALRQHTLIAPALLWSETLSALHESQWRGEASAALASPAIERLLAAPIERHASPELYTETRHVALTLGWAKTYDAEYIALARLSNCPLVTLDAKLQRGAGHLATIVAPGDLEL